MTKIWMLALVLAAACEPAGERPANQPGAVPDEGFQGARGTDDVTGDRAQDGTDGVRGTNGATPPSMPPAPGTEQGTAPGTAQAPMPGATADAKQAATQALQDAHQMHLHQVELARLANAKSENVAIKAYADQASREHKEADDKLAKLARDKDISLDAADAARYQNQRDTEARLQALEGAMFDQAYVVAMVEGGDEAVRVVQGVLTSTQDPEVKAYFTEIQPIVQGQADRAKQLRPSVRGTQ